MFIKNHNPLGARQQKGYSLVELSVALAIVAVILVGALLGTRQIMLTNSVNNQVRETATVITKIQRQYAKQSNTAGANTQMLVPLGIWPGERTSQANGTWTVRGVINSMTESVFANEAAIGTLPANGGFIYTLRGVPVEACADMVTALDSVAFAIYAGPQASSAPTTGATPTSTAVKTADSGSVNLTELARGCASSATTTPAAGGTPTTTAVTAVDIALVFRQ